MIIRLELKLKERIRKLAEAERRDMNSFVLCLFDKKIIEVENGRTN